MAIRSILMVTMLSLGTAGCAVYAVADAAVSVGATAVKATASAVGTVVDVTAAGVKAVVGADED